MCNAYLTIEEAGRLHDAALCLACWRTKYSEGEKAHVRDAIQKVIRAKSDKAASRHVRWWDCWDRKLSALAFCRRVRRMHAGLPLDPEPARILVTISRKTGLASITAETRNARDLTNMLSMPGWGRQALQDGVRLTLEECDE